MMQVGFHFILFSSHDYCYGFHQLESYLRVIYVFAKGPAGDCEDDIHFDNLFYGLRTCILMFVYK